MTTTITPDTTLAQIATDNPAAIGVFERYRLDYCCNGHTTLTEACQRAALDPDDVLRSIATAPRAATDADERDWTGASMSELADHLEQTHHRYVRVALDQIATTLARVVDAHAPNHPELLEIQPIFADFAAEMREHMIREERVLFPWLRRLEKPGAIMTGPPWSVQRPISCMEHDHDSAGAALVRMRRLTNDFTPPPDACTSYRVLLQSLDALERDTHIHIHKENNILFPAGVRAEAQRDAAPPQ